MKDIKNLGEIFEIEDSQNTVKLKLKTQDNFEGVGRLTGREQMILMFKANNDCDLKSYIYLKDGSVIFADCDSKLSDIHKWQLPAIVSFLQGQNIDLGPTHIFDKLAPVSNKQKKQDAPKKSSAFIQGGTDWLAQNIQGLTQEAPIDPKFATPAQQRFFDVVKAAINAKIPAGTKLELEPALKKYLTINNIDLQVEAYEQPDDAKYMGSFLLTVKVIRIPGYSVNLNDYRLPKDMKLPLGERETLVITESNIIPAIRDAVVEILNKYQDSQKTDSNKFNYLQESLKDYAQETEHKETEQSRAAYSRIESEDQGHQQRFSEILVLVSQTQQRGRVVFKPALEIPYADSINLLVNSITVKEGAYDLVLNLEHPLPFTNQYDLSISDKNCPKAIAEPLAVALEKIVGSKQ